jgi:hypothetical protein
MSHILRLNISSLPSISLNNTEIDTLINIYPSQIAAQTFYHLFSLQNHQLIERELKQKLIPSEQRFNFARLADEIIKNQENTSNSSLSIEPNILSTPAAITSGVSLLASTTTHSLVLQHKFQLNILFSFFLLKT